SWLAAQDRPKALHEAKGQMHALASNGFVLHGLTSDTALAAYLALPGQRTFDLSDLALRYLGKELSDTAGDNVQLTLDGSGEEEAALALARRAQATLDLAAALHPRRGPGEARRHPAAARDRAAARHGPGRDGADRHRGGQRALRRDVRDALRRGEERRAGGVRGGRHRG